MGVMTKNKFTKTNKMIKSRIILFAALIQTATLVSLQAQVQTKNNESPLNAKEQREWLKVLKSYDYTAIAAAYADYMIEHGRDVYGKPSPLFVTGIDRHTGKMISPPFPHVKRKPFMPGWERDRECRESDRNYGQADPLDQLVLLQVMHQLTDITGEKRYAREADKSAEWWMAHCQTPIGLYPWGTHAYWNVETDSGGEWFEFNHPWPYWGLNPEALQTYAMALWYHYVKDKNTGDFNRHANAYKHAPDGGMEFPWPGSAMIATWVEAYLANPDPEYKRAIITILKRWESLRDQNGHLAPCTKYQEWAWYGGYMVAANRLDDYAYLIEKKAPDLAAKMREYGLKCDAAYLKLADNLLDVKRVGIVKSYLRETGGYNPDRLDILGGPWQDRKDYAHLALLLYERSKRNNSEALSKRYNQAVLDAAEVYMSINPEVQWSVWGANMAYAIRLLLAAHDLTGNLAYLHRADHFGHLAVDLFLDETSPLPKITSHDDFYEIECVTGNPSDVWILAILELDQRLAKLNRQSRHPESISTGSDLAPFDRITVSGASAEDWKQVMKQTLAEGRGGIWDCSELNKPSASVDLVYGRNAERKLFLSRREGGFESSDGVSVDQLELIASDFIRKKPTLEEAKPFNGPYRRKFSGKYKEVSTAVYGGFKDVLDKTGLLLVNHSKEAVEVTVTATFHDSWDDRETKDYFVSLEPDARVMVACEAPDKRFIRRLDFKSSIPNAVKLKIFVFEMIPRSQLTVDKLQELRKEWGPFVGPWERYDKNPVIGLEERETYSIQNGPQSVIKWKDRWYMFLMTSQPMVTKLAVSDDGLTWRRPHHNYLLKPEMDWEGSYNLAKAAVVRNDEVWLYYFGKKDKTEMIALARSKDLENWQKEPKPIFTHKDSRIDGERAFPNCVMKEGDTWYMYYDVGFDYHHPKNPDGYAIGVATSKDGINWTDSPKSPVLTTSERTDSSWDDGMVSQCSVHKIGDRYYMLYSGSTNNYGRKYSGKNKMSFGLSRARHPEGPWEKYPNNPVFKPTGKEDDFDGIYIQHACPVKVGEQWRLYYSGWTKREDVKNSIGAEYAIGVAFVEDEPGSENK